MHGRWAEFDKIFLNVQKKLTLQKKYKIKIAFIDTGCDISHSFFNDYSIKCIDVDYKKNSLDSCGHGTFFASVLCKYLLVNKESIELISIKASDSHQIAIENVCKGIEIAIKEKADVLNIGVCNSNYDKKMAQLIKKAVDSGIIVIAPAGNNVKGVNLYPASLSTVISCAAIDSTGKIAHFSNVNDSVDIAVPGENIKGILTSGQAERMKLSLDEKNMVACSGTSFAAGILTAAAALIKLVDKNITYKQFRDILYTQNQIKCNVNFKNISVPVIDLEKMLEKIDAIQSDGVHYTNTLHWYISHIDMYSIKAEICDNYGNRICRICGNVIIRLYKYGYLNNHIDSDIIMEEIIKYEDGEFIWQYKGDEKGVYLLKIIDKDGRVEDTFTMMRFIPPKPFIEKIIGDEKRTIIELANQDKYEVYYSFDNNVLKVDLIRGLQPGTYKCKNRIEVSNEDCKYINIAYFLDGIFGEMLRIDIKHKKIV